MENTNEVNTINYSKQMFTVICSVTGESKKVRKPVFMNRVARVQKLVRSLSGKVPTVAEAVEVLQARYVSVAARKANNVNFIGQDAEEVATFKAMFKPAKARKVATKSEAPAATEAPASTEEATATA